MKRLLKLLSMPLPGWVTITLTLVLLVGMGTVVFLPIHPGGGTVVHGRVGAANLPIYNGGVTTVTALGINTPAPAASGEAQIARSLGIGTPVPAATGALSIGGTTGNFTCGTGNCDIQPGGSTGALFFNYLSGNGGQFFCNGASGCNASISTLGVITGTSVVDTALATTAPIVCTSAQTLTTACASPVPYSVANSTTVAPTAMPTGTPAAYTSYATPSVTTGVSTGATGAWLVEVSFYATVAGTSSAGATELCITSAAGGTNGGGSYAVPGTGPCAQTATNPLAGTYAQYTSGSTQYVAQEAFYEAVYANSTTVSFACQASVSNVTTPKIAGVCYEKAIPI